MRKEMTELDGVPVWFFFWPWAEEFLTARKEINPNDTTLFCAITGKLLDPQEGVVGVVCNYELFPNCNVSQKLLEEFGLELTARKIKESFTKAKLFKKENPQWLGLA